MVEISTKSRTATTLLAFFLGTLGIHRFYLGKKGTAITMLLLGLAGWILWIVGLVTAAAAAMSGGVIAGFGVAVIGYILVAIVGLWAFIDFIMAIAGAIKDGQGSQVKNW